MKPSSKKKGKHILIQEMQFLKSMFLHFNLRKQETMIKCMKRPFKWDNDHSMNNSKKAKNKANPNRQENQTKCLLFLKLMTIIEVIYVQENLNL
jgi:hypothetical protein